MFTLEEIDHLLTALDVHLAKEAADVPSDSRPPDFLTVILGEGMVNKAIKLAEEKRVAHSQLKRDVVKLKYKLVTLQEQLEGGELFDDAAAWLNKEGSIGGG